MNACMTDISSRIGSRKNENKLAIAGWERVTSPLAEKSAEKEERTEAIEAFERPEAFTRDVAQVLPTTC